MHGAASYDVWLVIMVLIGASLCMVPILILMRMTRDRKKEPIVFVSSDSARRHAALVWLIRGTHVITAVFAAILLLLIMVVLPLGAIGKVITDASNPWAFRITMVLAVLTMILLFGLIMKKVYYDNFRKDFWKVNADTVANFSSIFALLLAIDWYHLLPPHLPKVIADYCMRHVALAPFAEEGPGTTYRGVLSFIAFYLFFKLIRAYLMQYLELNASSPAQNQPSIDPDIPEFPRRSPLVQM